MKIEWKGDIIFFFLHTKRNLNVFFFRKQAIPYRQWIKITSQKIWITLHSISLFRKVCLNRIFFFINEHAKISFTLPVLSIYGALQLVQLSLFLLFKEKLLHLTLHKRLSSYSSSFQVTITWCVANSHQCHQKLKFFFSFFFFLFEF